MIVLATYGNSDDKLRQREWALFQIQLKDMLLDHDVVMLGDWHSYPDSIYQNAAYCFEVEDDKAQLLRDEIQAVAVQFKQDAISWNEMTTTLFLGPQVLRVEHPNSEKWAGSYTPQETT